ncbi:MAG: hypothetical protein R3Y53_04320 [Bacillota bacterium]
MRKIKSKNGSWGIKIEMVCITLLLFALTSCNNHSIQTDFRNATYVNAQKSNLTKTTLERVADIKNIISTYFQIVESGVVVEGHTAIVGVIYKEEVSHTAINRELKEQILKHDPYLERVSLTSTPYLVKMIQELEKM